MARFMTEEEICFTDSKIFKDTRKHPYEVKCFDGHAIGIAVDCEENDSAPKTIRVLYPLRNDILSDDRRAEYVLETRGLQELSPRAITYGDIMSCYGKVTLIKTRGRVSNAWSEFDKEVANKHMNKYGKVYLDEYDCPMDCDEVELLLRHSA